MRPDDPSTWPQPSLPLAAAAGRDAGEVARRYRDDGSTVELVEMDGAVDTDLRPDRVRLFVRDGRGARAVQG